MSALTREASADLNALWAKADALASKEFAAYMIEAFPDLATEYAALAAEVAAAWYAESLSTTLFVPVPGPLPAAEALTKSAQWALGGSGMIGLDRLQGTLQRSTWDAARQTIFTNTDEEGGRWARHASANACAFCALMASRGAVYTSEEAALKVVGRGKEMSLADRRARAAGRTRVNGHTAAGGMKTRGTQALGDKYHDFCHCIAIEERPGQKYEPPDYVQKWDEAYILASRETKKKGRYGAIDTKAVLAHMRENLGSH